MLDRDRDAFAPNVRLNGLGGHVDAVGKALTNAVGAYNRAVGSLEAACS